MSDATTYLVLLWGREEEWADADEATVAAAMAEHDRFTRALAEGGHEIVGGDALAPAATARVVRRGDDPDDLTVTDGPYAEAVEQLGGYYAVRTADLAGLTALVGIVVGTGTVEIRPVETYA
ncbi:YciI family protein [Cellulomonas oligotrophica]|uniref:YCII-related domain-containing protein n=1 Tax=Cellulomonas oligotrophica TaxID=931536 RepID=A0A7Y9FFB3_9CELL|nr:YciI family protein [Cellulomonas oligotrophica]NYD86304.1 hypothetical protein [Cellulomonas oligotrophica]GIG32805.1 hypothetical protein Col01nite_19640 [Cellulomonas oligotrophica]